MKGAQGKSTDFGNGKKTGTGTVLGAGGNAGDVEAQVKAVEEQLLSEFYTSLVPVPPSSPHQLSRLHSAYNSLLHSNRRKQRLLSDLQNHFTDLSLSNRLPDSRSRHSERSLSKDPEMELVSRIQNREDAVENEGRETERLYALFQKTQRTAADMKHKSLSLQKHLSVILSKYEEVRRLQDKAKYDLQHAKAEVHLASEEWKKQAEKRLEQINKLRSEKRNVETEAANTVKSLAEHLVSGHNTQTLASYHADQLTTIYTQHLHSQSMKIHDINTINALKEALHTVCSVVNRSETLGLEGKVREVNVGDVISYAHQYEMKMASLESQVQSLSEAKQELEGSCGVVRKELAGLESMQGEVSAVLGRVESRVKDMGLGQFVGSLNQLKEMLENVETDIDGEECERHDAFLASAFMTFHIEIRRLQTLLTFISSHTNGDSLSISINWSSLLSSSNCDRSDDPTDFEAFHSTLKDAFEELSDTGLDPDFLIKQASDLLFLRLFLSEPRLKDDLRTWKSGQLSIIGENFPTLLLCKLISLSQEYYRERLQLTCMEIRNIIVGIKDKMNTVDQENRKIRLTEAQLEAFIMFQLSQNTGNAGKNVENEGINRAFEQKYAKLMLQQREKPVRRTNFQSYTGIHRDSQALSDSEETEYGRKQRKPGKNGGNSEKNGGKGKGNKGYLQEMGKNGENVEAFAEVRAMNLRIRSIKEIEYKPMSSTPKGRYLPSIQSARSLKSVYSPGFSSRSQHGVSSFL